MSTRESIEYDIAYEREWDHKECLDCGYMNMYCKCEDEEVDYEYLDSRNVIDVD
jgi:Zn ribbon nucleic-acid-binding protein